MKIRKFLLASTFLVGLTISEPAKADPVSLIASGASALGFTEFAAFVGSFFGRLVVTAGLTAVASYLSSQDQPTTPDYRGITQREENFTDSLAVRQVIYGRVMVGGPIVYAETTNHNNYLHLVIPVAGHEITAFDKIYFNDDELTLDGSGNVTAPAQYAGKARIKTYLGTTSQSADPDLIAESNGLWTSNHKLTGVAYIYARLAFDQDAFPNGRPTIKAIVRGKKIYDPRTATTGYSANPALCVLDYLRDSTFGFGATLSEINTTTFNAAANICDENVALAAGGTEKRYECHGVIMSDRTPKSALEDLLTSCGGMIFYSGGKWNMNASAYNTPTVTLTDNDLRAPINLVTRHSKRDNFNIVKGVFVSPDDGWQATDFPAIKSTTFIADDYNIESSFDLTLPFTISSPMAQRLAKIALYRHRQQMTLELKCKMTAFQIEVGDTIMVTNTRYGFSSKPFEVINFNFAIEGTSEAPVFGVDLTLREISSSVFDWNAEETAIERDNTSLPNYSSVAVPQITASDELRAVNQDVVTVLLVNVSSTNPFVTDYEVSYKKQSDSVYTEANKSTSGKYEILKVEDGVYYDIRSRAVTFLGVKSDYQTLAYQVIGKTAPPSDVTGLSINSIGGSAILQWTPVADLDLSHYKVRYSASTSSATYQNAIDLVDKVARPANSVIVPSKQGTYFVKAVDKLNYVSANPASVVLLTNISNVNDLNVVATVTENPAFSGTKTSVVKTTDGVSTWIQLDTAGLFDSTSGNFDSAGGLFDAGGGTIATSGYYEFANYIDLTEKYTSRVTASLNNIRIDYTDLFDSATGNFDDRSGNFDGSATAFDDTSVALQVATTDGDPAGSPTWSSWQNFLVGDYSARAFKFRAYLTSSNGNASPSITNLSVSVDMPDRVISGEDIVSGAGTYTVTFSPAYKSLDGIGISAQNMGTGDYYSISSKSTTGFQIVFRNSAGTAVSRTFDYVARGYGKVVV